MTFVVPERQDIYKDEIKKIKKRNIAFRTRIKLKGQKQKTTNKIAALKRQIKCYEDIVHLIQIDVLNGFQSGVELMFAILKRR